MAEDERGTYLFSARDLCLMPLLPDLCEAGVSSLKIEGRMKTEYYVAVVTGAYRQALDLLAQGRECFTEKLPALMEELRCASHRLSDTRRSGDGWKKMPMFPPLAISSCMIGKIPAQAIIQEILIMWASLSPSTVLR